MFKEKDRIKILKEQIQQLKEENKELKAQNERLNERAEIVEKTRIQYEKAIADVKKCREEYDNLIHKMKNYNSKLKEKYKPII